MNLNNLSVFQGEQTRQATPEANRETFPVLVSFSLLSSSTE